MQINDIFLGALFPVVTFIVDWLKEVPYIAKKKIKPIVLNVSVSVVLTTIYYVLPEAVHQYILTVAIPVGLAAVFYEGKKVSNSMQVVAEQVPLEISGTPDTEISIDPQ